MKELKSHAGWLANRSLARVPGERRLVEAAGVELEISGFSNLLMGRDF